MLTMMLGLGLVCAFLSVVLLVSGPSGSAVRQKKTGDTVIPHGACTTAETLPECRASVRDVGPFTRGSS